MFNRNSCKPTIVWEFKCPFFTEDKSDTRSSWCGFFVPTHNDDMRCSMMGFSGKCGNEKSITAANKKIALIKELFD